MMKLIRKLTRKLRENRLEKRRFLCSHHNIISKGSWWRGSGDEIRFCLDCGALMKSNVSTDEIDERIITFRGFERIQGKPILRFHEYSGMYELRGVKDE